MSLVDVPSSLRIDGEVCIVIDTKLNYNYRALVLPSLGAPRWLSNKEVAACTGQAAKEVE